MIIKKKLPIPPLHEKHISRIFKTLNNAGFECFIVGGSVRDMLLELPVYDFDFTTNARPDQITSLFKHTVPTGIKHGTLTLLFDRLSYEITTYRSDGEYSDGRRPDEVYFSDSLEEDIMRRDFTINGIAYNYNTFELIDYCGGIQDLEDHVIKAIGSPEKRLSEDGLRGYRACRFAAKLNFQIDRSTLKAIKTTLDVSSLVSVERIRDEIMKLMGSPKPSIGIEYMRMTGLLGLCLPELADTYGIKQNKYHKYDVYYHCLYSCDAAPQTRPLIRLASLLHDIGKLPCRATGADGDYTFYNHEIVGFRMAKRIMKRLKFSNDEIEEVSNLIVNHMFHYTNEWTDGAVRRFIRKVGIENIEDLLLLREADRVGNGSRSGLAEPVFKLQRRIEEIIEKENAMSIRDLDINGNILIETFSLTQSPIIGKILNHLLELVLDDPAVNNRDSLLKLSEDFIAMHRDKD